MSASTYSPSRASTETFVSQTAGPLLGEKQKDFAAGLATVQQSYGFSPSYSYVVPDLSTRSTKKQSSAAKMSRKTVSPSATAVDAEKDFVAGLAAVQQAYGFSPQYAYVVPDLSSRSKKASPKMSDKDFMRSYSLGGLSYEGAKLEAVSTTSSASSEKSTSAPFGSRFLRAFKGRRT